MTGYEGLKFKVEVRARDRRGDSHQYRPDGQCHGDQVRFHAIQ